MVHHFYPELHSKAQETRAPDDDQKDISPTNNTLATPSAFDEKEKTAVSMETHSNCHPAVCDFPSSFLLGPTQPSTSEAPSGTSFDSIIITSTDGTTALTDRTPSTASTLSTSSHFSLGALPPSSSKYQGEKRKVCSQPIQPQSPCSSASTSASAPSLTSAPLSLSPAPSPSLLVPSPSSSLRRHVCSQVNHQGSPEYKRFRAHTHPSVRSSSSSLGPRVTREEDILQGFTRRNELEAFSSSRPMPGPLSTEPPQREQGSEPSTESTESNDQALSPPVHSPTLIQVNANTFTVLRSIGQGGSSFVHRVMANDNRLFALKCVKLEEVSRDEQEMFMNEIDFLRGLRNKDRVIQLYDYEFTLESNYILMLMEIGEIDLATIMKQWKGREKDMIFVRSYWKQMLLAVQSIHKEGIVHSDLKPANFLLVLGNLKLIDFGISKRIPSGSNDSCSHRKIGTADYMSPESLRDTREDQSIGRAVIRMGLASDIWSLGCILYQMLYDHTPFVEEDLRKKLRLIISESSFIGYPEWLEYNLNEEAGETHGGEEEYVGGVDSSGPARARERLKVQVKVDVNGIDTIQACLQHDHKRRPTISQLLQGPLLHPGERHMNISSI